MIVQSWLTVIMIDIDHVFPPINIKFGIWIYYQCPNMLLKKIVQKIVQIGHISIMIKVHYEWGLSWVKFIINEGHYFLCQSYLCRNVNYIWKSMTLMLAQTCHSWLCKLVFFVEPFSAQSDIPDFLLL